MSLIGALRTGVSGMNAQSNRISTVAENIQNSSTTGYKRSSTEFSSLLVADSAGGNYNSGAVETIVRRSINEGGTPLTTTSNSDLAISGSGFFVVNDAAGAPYLTRAGNFVVDGTTKNLTNAAGMTLMGYSILDGEANPTLNSVADMVPVNIATVSARAVATTEGAFSGNLSLEATTTGTGQYAKKTSLVTYDKLGQAKTLDVYMAKNSDSTWTISIYDAATATSAGGTALPTSAALVTTTIGFDGNGKISGTQVAGPPIAYTGDKSISLTVPGGSGKAMTLDIAGLTQLSGDYGLTGSADGQAPSAVTGTEFGSDGTVYATFADGSRLAAFKVPLATVTSPDNLEPRSGNVFVPSVDSGDIQVGFAEQNGLGTIKSGALEQSNVDVSTELTAMIESQSIYTANSKVFTTGNEMLDTLMNLKR